MHTGPVRPRLLWSSTLTALLTAACGGDETIRTPPEAFAMTPETAPFYDDGEVTLYQVQREVALPVIAPTAAQREARSRRVPPFERQPWVTIDDVAVQVTFTLANLERDDHTVKVLVDPINEFGRYVPGFSGVGEEAVPNLSGFEQSYVVPGTASDRSSRIHRTLTYGDMEELATDFATAIGILADPPAAEEGQEDPSVGLVNHTFAVENRHGSSPLTDGYTPSQVPALVGFVIGLRSEAPVTLVLEWTVEVVDRHGERIREDGDDEPLLDPPARVYTIGG